jgi:DNA polymerase III subunit gamma/tau
MSQAFYRKWRPQTWDEVVAQDHVVQTLRNAVRTGRTGHAYLLAGPRGTGKTTTARLLAKALNCLDPDPAKRPCDHCQHCQALNEGRFLDLIEIDAASNTSVEDVRDLRDKINFRPTQGEYKVYIIDEVHMLSTAAFNALLKTLEEPPPHAVFILATTEIHKIPATILSRCQRYEFKRIPVTEIVRYLRKMADEEKLVVDEDALVLIARQATGAMRDAISLLDQLSSTGERVTLAEAQVVLGTATSGMVLDLVGAVINRDAATGLKLIQSALDAGTDARQFARQVVDYLRGLLLIRLGNADQVDATQEVRTRMAAHANELETAHLLEIIRLFNSAAVDVRSSWHTGLALELALAEAIEEKAAPVSVEQAQTAQPPAARPKPTAPAAEAPRPTQERQAPAAERSQPSPAKPQPGADRPQTGAARTQPETEKASQARPQQSAGKPQPGAEKSAPPASGAAANPAGGKAFTQQELQQNWSKVKQLVKKRNPLTEGLLNSARSMVIKGDVLVLGFQSEVVKSKMEIAENVELLRQALQAALGASLAVRCVVVGNKAATPDDLGIDGDGMVGTALDLGGKIAYDE